MLETFDDLENKIILKDLNLFLDFVLEAKGGGPVLKKSSVSKLIEIKEKCNINLTFGEIEIQKKNALHFDKNIAQVFYKED